MGMGLSIEAITREWPTEEVPVRCSQCGSLLKLTRYQRIPLHELDPEIVAQESEQYCPVCGASACEEIKGKSIKASDFFSAFRK